MIAEDAIDLVINKLREIESNRSYLLSQGRAQDFGQYQYESGVISGIRMSIAELVDRRKSLVED